MACVKKHITESCELCGIDDDLNFHHLIPRTLHGNKYFKELYDKDFMSCNGIWICRDYCHKEIHKYLTEKKMGRSFNTIEKLLAHPKIKKYVDWRRRQLDKKCGS